MASKAEKRRRKRRLVHQGVVPPSETEAGAVPEDAEPADATGGSGSPKRGSGPRRAERNADDERPPAPWGKFPLTEIAVFLGIVMVVAGFFFVSGNAGKVLLLGGLGLSALGGLDTALREHFAGFRSHTFLLAGVPAGLVLVVLVVAGPDSITRGVALLIAVAVFGASVALFARVFRSRSGGRWFRIGRGFRQ